MWSFFTPQYFLVLKTNACAYLAFKRVRISSLLKKKRIELYIQHHHDMHDQNKTCHSGSLVIILRISYMHTPPFQKFAPGVIELILIRLITTVYRR